MKQKTFDDVAKQVSMACRNLDYSCLFNYEQSYFYVYSNCSDGKMLITANLIDILHIFLMFILTLFPLMMMVGYTVYF